LDNECGERKNAKANSNGQNNLISLAQRIVIARVKNARLKWFRT